MPYKHLTHFFWSDPNPPLFAHSANLSRQDTFVVVDESFSFIFCVCCIVFCKKYKTVQRGTSALHLNEATWIIDGSNELIVDFLFALVLFLYSTQLRPLKYPKYIHFFLLKQTNVQIPNQT